MMSVGVDPTCRIRWSRVRSEAKASSLCPTNSYMWVRSVDVGRCRCDTYKDAPGKRETLALGLGGIKECGSIRL